MVGPGCDQSTRCADERLFVMRHERALGNGHIDRVSIVVGQPLPRVVLRNDPIHGVYPGALRNGDVVDGQQTWDAVR